MARLDDDSRTSFFAEHPDWSLEDEAISRTFQFDDFKEALAFVVRVGLAAEVADHHPDIDIRWSRVTLTLSTHFESALTERDTALATQCDGFVGSD